MINKQISFIRVAAMTVFLSGFTAQAETLTFIGPNGIWNTAASWSGGNVPGVGDQIIFNVSSTNTGWKPTINVGNTDKTIGAGERSFWVDGLDMQILDSTKTGNVFIDAATNGVNQTLLVSGNGSLKVGPTSTTRFTKLYFKNTASSGNGFGQTTIATDDGSIDFQGDLVAQTSLTIAANEASDVISLAGPISLNANRGLWLTDSGGTINMTAPISGVAGSFVEVGTDLTLGVGASFRVSRIGLTGSNTVLTLETANALGGSLDTLDTSGVAAAGPRTLDLTTVGNDGFGSLALADAHTLHIDFSDPAENGLEFGPSGAQNWHSNATLNLIGFDVNTDALRFGFNENGLTAQQLAQITIDDAFGSYSLNNDGYLNREDIIKPVTPPNVIIIFTDDHGYTDLGLHGIDANIQTPVLDSLAAGGALMQHGYSTAPQCVPSRSGILSGRIQNSFGTEGNGTPVPFPLEVPMIAERLQDAGVYTTGMIGKWHVSPRADATNFPGSRASYAAANRGFDEYWDGALDSYSANFNLDGSTLDPPVRIADSRNRVIVQGEAAEAFIQRNQNDPFFLYLALYGPHTPTISTNDSYYIDFLAMDYPQYSAEMDDVRRKGLGLIHAIDDAVGGVIARLEAAGILENTLILFAGDNGAQPKFWNVVGGATSIKAWDGSENVPLRGEKGSLWEGGIKVPMFAYWKDHIPTNQIIDEAVWTLDFSATLMKLATGIIPPEFDGVDILPRLTGTVSRIERSKPMFWNWGREVAIRKGDWKLHRIHTRTSLFNLKNDPMELYDLRLQLPEKHDELHDEVMTWYNSLPAEGQSPLGSIAAGLYETGAPGNILPDPRFIAPYIDGVATAYPAPLTLVAPSFDSDADGMVDGDEGIAGTDASDRHSFFALEPTAEGTLIWEGKNGRAYTIWGTPELEPADWKAVTNLPALLSDQLMQIDFAPSSTSGFYRVEVSQP